MNGQSTERRTAGGRRSWLINPLLGKEFTLRMRTPRSMWAILVYLLAIGLLAFGFLYVMNIGGGQQGFDPSESRNMFMFISVAQLILIAFMAPGLTAGVVSGEREKQTLSLLLTTQQSNTSIILSKLASSLSFMVLIIVATLPVYSVVFLFGGISPAQVGLVFLFYLFTMLTLGSFGVLFSTLFKRTMISVIVTYGTTLFLFGGTAFLYLILGEALDRYYNVQMGQTDPAGWIGHLLAINPVAALISIFEPDISRSAFRVNRFGGSGDAPIALWTEYLIVYAGLTVLAVAQSIYSIRPRLKRRKRKSAKQAR